MRNRVLVRKVMLYTRSEDPHDRQIVAVMTNGREYRFSEGEMLERGLPKGLKYAALRVIESMAYEKAQLFDKEEDEEWATEQAEKDWDCVQTLLYEFQKLLESRPRYRSALIEHLD